MMCRFSFLTAKSGFNKRVVGVEEFLDEGPRSASVGFPVMASPHPHHGW
jgi:hypothetical protein